MYTIPMYNCISILNSNTYAHKYIHMKRKSTKEQYVRNIEFYSMWKRERKKQIIMGEKKKLKASTLTLNSLLVNAVRK